MAEGNINSRIINLVSGFEKDGFTIDKILVKSGRVGIEARHKTAFNYDTGQKKKAYYLEGSPYEMGYLLGLLAEEDIARMTDEFANNIVFDFIGFKELEKVKELGELLVLVVYQLAKRVYPGLPREFKDELRGVADGCKEARPGTRVDMEHLIVLNLGIDVLCSLVYTGDFLLKKIPGIRQAALKVPIMCNAFSVFGKEAGCGHYFGRDFMFPTGGVFQDTACMIVYNPDCGEKKALPFVSFTAAGLLGSMTAMNINAVAAGVDMSPSGNCDPRNVGVNSLLLTRMAIQYGENAEQALSVIKETPRGVSWNYIISDGTLDRACVVEAGCSNDFEDYLEFPSDELKPFLPDADFVRGNRSAEYTNGIMVRWSDYVYPSGYFSFNPGLWEHYNSACGKKAILYPDAFSDGGCINREFTEKNCPSAFYFAPLRECRGNMLLATNHYIIPEMRLYAMYPWTAMIVGDIIDDIQWRYDELSRQILETLDARGCIDYESARGLIDFLAPDRKFPAYYAQNPRSRDGREIAIKGCTSLLDLKHRTIESHYGYFCDEWVKMALPNYFE